MKTIAKPLIKQGWLRALLFLIPWLIFTALFEWGAHAITYSISGKAVETGDNIETVIRFFITALGTTLIIFAWRKLIDRKNFKSLGFEWKAFATDAWLGFFTGPALLGIGTLILVVLSYLQFNVINSDVLRLLWEALLMLLIAYSEEIIIRGYILNNLLQSFNKWLALCLSSALFALMHLANPDVSILSFTNILIAGFLLGINYIYTKNLWFGIFFHFSWNFFQGPVYGYEVSGIKFPGLFDQSLQGPPLITGGSFGFEGSVLCPVLTAIATIIFAVYFNRRYNQNVKANEQANRNADDFSDQRISSLHRD